MQVNKKPLIIIFSFLCIFLFIYGCTTSQSSSSISGKLIISPVEILSLQITNTSGISLKDYYDKKKAGSSGPEFVPDEIIVKYKPGLDPDYMAISTAGSGYSTAKGSNKTGRGAVRVLKLDHAEKALHLTSSIRDRTLKEIERLNNLPYVEYAEPNYIYRTLSLPNDTKYDLLWHYTLIKLDEFWTDDSLDSLNDLSSVTVAVIDSGIARWDNSGTWDNHLDLDGIFIDEYDFIENDSDARDPGELYHGTHVAGTIGALTNDKNGIAGVAGGNGIPGPIVFTGVKIMPLRVMNTSGTGDLYDIEQAIRYAAGLANASGTFPSKKADIINLSIGIYANPKTFKNAIDAAYSAGVTIVAAAGNDSTDYPLYPAAYTNVISVAAVGAGAERAYYSNYGDTIDITAPGGDMRFDLDFNSSLDGILSTIILSTIIEDPDKSVYEYWEGTSMAAPHVAGVAALVVKALGGNPLPSTVKDKLTGTAIYLGDSEFYGAGLVNAYAAVCSALGQSQGAVLHPFPKTVRLEGLVSIGSFTLKNIGNSEIINITGFNKIDEYTSAPSELLPVSSIFPPSGQVNSGGLEVQLTLNISDKKDGATHHALIEIDNSTGNPEYVNVIYKYIGDIYVVALDPYTNEIIGLDVTNYEKGYEYSIEDLKAGRYIIGASTDRDNDLIIFGDDDCEEAYGYFPDINYEAILELNAGKNLSGVDFHVIDWLS